MGNMLRPPKKKKLIFQKIQKGLLLQNPKSQKRSKTNTRSSLSAFFRKSNLRCLAADRPPPGPRRHVLAHSNARRCIRLRSTWRPRERLNICEAKQKPARLGVVCVAFRMVFSNTKPPGPPSWDVVWRFLIGFEQHKTNQDPT